ncbi:MAG TPA: D-alanyl-D-alanine carboxypeptidase family protein [Acidimicrobiales bacterium]|nr:D-alanyl-D-alanine carboxypeptidase family protein [Acidimicrobiales bacterium]
MDVPLLILDLVRPDDLQGRTNGGLPTDLLRQVKDVGQLHHLAARAWTAMRIAAEADGVELNPRFPGNAYRPFEQQERIFRDRYRAEDTDEGRRLRVQRRPHKMFQGKRWYQRPNTAEAASPGSSNHGWGLAVDVDSVELGGRFPWLERNALRFGFSWELQSERWHVRYVRAEEVPRAVLDVEANGPGGDDGGTEPKEDDEMTPDQARKLELIYNALCGGLERGGIDPGSIDLGGPILTTHHLAHLLIAGQDRVADPQTIAEAMVEQLDQELVTEIHVALGNELNKRTRGLR